MLPGQFSQSLRPGRRHPSVSCAAAQPRTAFPSPERIDPQDGVFSASSAVFWFTACRLSFTDCCVCLITETITLIGKFVFPFQFVRPVSEHMVLHPHIRSILKTAACHSWF